MPKIGNYRFGQIRSYSGKYPAHRHNYVQILIGLEGCLHLNVEGKNIHVDGTTGLVIPSGLLHTYSTYDDAHLLIVETDTYDGLNQLKAFGVPSNFRGFNDANEALAFIKVAPRVLNRRQVDPNILRTHLQGSLHESWPIQRMSEIYSLSIPQFYRRWKNVTGETPQYWLRQLRLKQAEKLLSAGHNLDFTAIQVGYRVEVRCVMR